ncbi:hypothetical protein ACHHYP_13037 [Achlya hypogyna]|uniref:HMA domain-containing protein n=1 Tax=Achlya hypogyna TaxID=1202772 RepID=A0A1V9YG83_ACHHY|nr:hypothetical protein ACHHYP_13037 [Achlya hypogyna]
MADVVTVFNVGMTCGGCSSACERILLKIDGVKSVACDIDAKTVVVTGTADPQVMLAALLKWSAASGKSVELA